MKPLASVSALKPPLTTSTLCKAANVSRGQLRLYEKEGLIVPQGRTGAGYRQYGSDTLDRIKAIMQLKGLGFRLTEIALLLSSRDQGELSEQAVQKLAASVVIKIDERIAALQVIREYAAPVAAGDMRMLQDEDCNFLIEFMTALSFGQRKPDSDSFVAPSKHAT